MFRVAQRSRHVLRWALIGKGQLKRGTDRIETGFRLFLLVALLAAAPLGFAVGAMVHSRQTVAAAQQLRERHQVHALVLADPQLPTGSESDGGVVKTEVAWYPAAGTERTASVPVPLTVRADDRVPIWVTADGHVTDPPLDSDTVAGNAVSVGFLTGVSVPLVGWALLGLARVALNVHRSRQWQADWLAVEPLWTSQDR